MNLVNLKAPNKDVRSMLKTPRQCTTLSNTMHEIRNHNFSIQWSEQCQDQKTNKISTKKLCRAAWSFYSINYVTSIAFLPANLTENSFLSFPNWFFASQTYHPSSFKEIVKTSDALTTTLEFHIAFVCMGGVPVAEHDIL